MFASVLISRSSLLGLAAFALPALSLVLPSGYSWGALLLVLLGLTALPNLLRNRPTWPPELRIWGLTVLSMGMVWAMHLGGTDAMLTRTLGSDRVSKYALALVAVPAVLTALRTPWALAWGCWAGAGLAGAIAIWDTVVLQLHRAEGHTNAIHFGNIALLLTTWGMLWTLHPKARPWRGWAWTGCCLGVIALLLSGSRGGWITVPLLLVLVLWQWRHRELAMTPRSRLPWLLGGVLGLVLVANLPSVQQRIQMAQSEWQGWLQTGESNNSVGQRLAHWQFAWTVFKERPLLGWGQAGYDAERLQAVEAGRAPEPLSRFNHAHNEWLDMAAKRGLVGLAALLAFYAAPGWLYARRLWQFPSPTVRTLALCGLATVLGYLGFGLTQVMFAHNSGNMVYLFMNTLWLGALAQQTDSAHAP